MRDNLISAGIRRIIREMSDVRDYELADSIDVGAPPRLKALGDPLRMRITELVLERAMSVSELAERLGRAKGTIAYHVDVLVDAGLLTIVRTRRVRAVDERFYGRVALTYAFPRTGDEIPFLDDLRRSFDAEQWAGGTDDGIATLRRVRIPAERAAEYAERLLALTGEFVDEPRDGDREYGMYVVLFPARDQPRDTVTRDDMSESERE